MFLAIARFFYNLFLPIGFLFFLPGLIWKYKNRGGYKATFAERFGRFSPERKQELAVFRGAVWIHAVSVGETVLALSLLREYQARCPEKKFVLSTGTTTAQELARKQIPPDAAVIFAPIDYFLWVRRALNLIRPSQLVIFETEIWPNLIVESANRGVEVFLVNARLSDHSSRGYYRARAFFAPLLARFTLIAAQSEADAERLRRVAPKAHVATTGNLKFDQRIPAELKAVDYAAIFAPDCRILLGASTHPGEEALLIRVFASLAERDPALRLVLVPRHAERGGEIVELLRAAALPFVRRSSGEADAVPKVLLADTTGEMLRLMAGADVVVMGKSLAGQDEGHNLIEPALLDKAIVCGSVLRNFRQVLQILRDADALRIVKNDAELEGVLEMLLNDAAERRRLGERAGAAIRLHAGALERTLELLNQK